MNGKAKTYEKRILEFISANSRNKLIIVRNELEYLQFNNLNRELSIILHEVKPGSHFSMKAKDMIAAYFNSILKNDSDHGMNLTIQDVGILLQKELQFDFRVFLDQYSQNQTLFLKWDGEIIDNKLYFLTKQNGIEIDISDLSHIII